MIPIRHYHLLLGLVMLGLAWSACGGAPQTAVATPTVASTPTATLAPTETEAEPPALQTATMSPSATPLGPPPAVPEATAGPPDLTVGDCPDGDTPRPCADDYAGWVRRLSAPPGFEISFVAALPEGLTPTTMTFGPDERLYVATVPNPFQDESRMGTIWVLDGEQFVEYATGFLLPAGLAFRPGTLELYVSHRASDEEGQLSRIPAGGGASDAIVTGLPCCYTAREHQPNGIVFGPDAFIYMGIGALTDHGPDPGDDLPDELHPLEAGILRINPDGAKVEKYADGFRNPYDLAFDSTGQLWVADNGADFGPPERLYRVDEGGHYGFPYYEDCEVCLPAPPGLTITPPYVEFMPHATPAGMVAYTGYQYPANYFDNLFVTMWNPWAMPGLWRVRPTGETEPFVLGLFSPVDVVLAPDGSLVVADFFFGHIFRIRWVGRS